MAPIVTASAAAISEAADLIRAGALVAFPTETVYGLGADATNGDAVARIYAAKGRPSHNPLIAHVASWEMVHRLGVLDGPLATLAKAVWPGPLTVVVPKVPGGPVSDAATAGLGTVAIRWPSRPVAQALIRAAGVPIVAPSANRSGYVSAIQPADVVADLGDSVAMVLDDGASVDVGVESTIVIAHAAGDQPAAIEILRPGAITADQIRRATGCAVISSARVDDVAPTSPGQLESHYAPRALVCLNVTAPEPTDVWLSFAVMPGTATGARAAAELPLSPRGDLDEAAGRLFALLRHADTLIREWPAGTATRIAVAPIPETGIGIAINDRLRRAAAPRPDAS